ncbi:MAG: molybdenum cofactor guanylyltransferase [Thermacetogeniaceae bacterium]
MLDAAAIILAGGKSSRFCGNKALVEISSQRLIDRVVYKLKDFFTLLVLVTNSPEEYQGLAVEIVCDLIPGKGPLSGIHAGLVASPYSLNFVVGCDMPFVSGELGAFLVERADPRDDAVVPFVNGYAEPLSAVYRKTCIPFIEASLLAGKPKVAAFYDQVRVKYVRDEEIVAFGGADCFFNINSREDLKKAFQRLTK